MQGTEDLDQQKRSGSPWGFDLIRCYGAQACALRLAALTLTPEQNSHRWEAQQKERAIGRPSAVELHDEEPPVLSVSVAVFQHTIGLLNCRDQAKIHQTWNNKRLKFIQTNGDDRRCLSHLFDSSRIKHINVADQTALLVLCVEPQFLSQSGKWQCCNHCLTKQYGQINLKDPVLVTFKLNFRDLYNLYSHII